VARNIVPGRVKSLFMDTFQRQQTNKHCRANSKKKHYFQNHYIEQMFCCQVMLCLINQGYGASARLKE
jgi:hypothetical protein